ncbi:MAG: hypothetical protein O7D30_09720 [Rickettsia endosymbiont of Ixodes persulcatus]|nr:hypothetical protein [Rickettsia endosymbiont of Ixodes persulcatus]
MNNSRARLSFNIDNGKATSYKQTMMDNIEAAKGSNSSKKPSHRPEKGYRSFILQPLPQSS